MNDFNGVKAALIFENQLLVYLRDNKPRLRFANMWDFPGGGREQNETPFECLKRETTEEFAIKLSGNNILWQKRHPSMHDPKLHGYFFVLTIEKEDVAGIKFGSEGQEWRFMDIDEFLNREDVVPFLKVRLRDYLNTVN